MEVTVKSFVSGVPQFHKEPPIPNRSLLSENRSLQLLKPADQTKNRTILWIQRIFQRILNWLYPFARTNYVGVVAALDRSAETGFNTLSQGEMLSYFEKFFKSDQASSPALQKCVARLREQYETVDPKKQEALLARTIQEVEHLPEGEQSLVLANRNQGDELFYLFSKKGGSLQLQVIGRGASMVRLSGIEEVAVAGQAKIVSCLNYGAIGADLVRPLLDLKPESPPLEELLKGRPLVNEDLSLNLATKTADVFGVFWTALGHVEKNQGKTTGDFQRTQLRLDLFTLFSLLKEYRFSLGSDLIEVQTLSRMLLISSQNLKAAFDTGAISQSELEALVGELTLIQKAIDHAGQGEKTPLDSLKMAHMSQYPVLLNAVAAPAEIATPAVKKVADPRHPNLTPPNDAGAVIVRQFSRLDPAMGISERLKILIEKGSPQQMVEAIYEIPFLPYGEDAHGRKLDPDSEWVKFSPEKAKEIMGYLNTLSKRLVDSSIKEKELSMDEYEALIKMSYMVAFLNHHIVNRGIFSEESFCLINKIGAFGNKVSSRFHLDKNRYGHCIHPKNVSTIKESQIFYWNMLSLQNAATGLSSTKRDLSEPIAGLTHLQAQVDLLSYVLPHHPSQFDEKGILAPSVHGWIAPLPMSFLAVYHLMKMRPDVDISSVREKTTQSNRDTPEGIQHDPENTLREFEETAMGEELKKWRENIEEELKNGQKKERSYQRYERADIPLSGSPYTGETRRQQLTALLKKQEEHLLMASQMGIDLSKEELTALLSLLRSDGAQREALSFLHTHTDLLAKPAIRSFVQLIFFHPSLMDTLKEDYAFVSFGGKSGGTFCRMAPEFFAEKIDEYQTRVERDPSEMTTLLFFLEMSERLKGIYEVLQKEKGRENAFKFDTSRFFPAAEGRIQAFLDAQREKDPTSAVGIEVTAFQLKILLAKKELTEEEICKVILDMDLLRTASHKVSSFDYRELFWIKGAYQELIKGLSNPLNKEHTDYLLDTLCQRKGLVLDASSWSGSFPVFSNKQYYVDLERGTVTDIASESLATTLPVGLVTSSLFKKSFPELKGEVKAMKVEMQDGAKVYFFDDLKKNPCRVEERGESFFLYRSFPKAGHPEFLQAASFEGDESSREALQALLGKYADASNKNKRPGFFQQLRELYGALKKEPQLPAFLQQRLFIDPKNPLKGYIVSSEGEMDIELALERTGSGVRIKHAVDLREGKRSEPMDLVGLDAMNDPALKQLEQIEDPSHILVWGKGGGFFHNGSIDKIELPRYGLQFSLRDGYLVCTDPKYAGYRVSLSSTLEERKGFAFSLLLEHPDRTRPKKLLLPPSNAIKTGAAPEPPYFGLAKIIWLIKTLFSLIFHHTMPKIFASPFLHIETDAEKLTPIAIDLLPHTDEILYTPGKELEQSQELITHALLLNDSQLALELVQPVQIEPEERSIGKWNRFLDHLPETGIAAAVGLKISEKIFEKIRGQKKFEPMCKHLNGIEQRLFKTYLKEAERVSAPLCCSAKVFERLSDQLKKEDPLYFQKHLTPFYLKPGDTFALPVARANEAAPSVPQVGEATVQGQRQEISKIAVLEEQIHPEAPLDRESLSKDFPLVFPVPLLFDPGQLSAYFDPNKKLIAEETLLNGVVWPKLKELEAEKLRAQQAIKELLFHPSDPVEQLAIYAKEKRIAQFSDLHVALLQNDFDSLKDALPNGTDLVKLRSALIHFYDLEVKLQLITRCKTDLTSMLLEKKKMSATIWEAKSAALFDGLTYGRQYLPETNPELLAFEAFHFLTFRNSIEPTQLELLQQLLKTPASIVQAGTGTGKSSVLSVLRGLLRANGKNLVSQKVLPHLFPETVAILQERLGHTYKRKVYPLLFNQSMPLYDKEGNSLFEQIYCKLLETIQNKGCVLTDYKSFVLLEEKFLSLSKQLAGDRENGVSSSPVQMTHWFYLAKILILLKNRDDQLMDEFDQPMSAIQRIQTQLREGPLFERWMIDHSLDLFDLLQKEKSLLLAENLQGDIPKKQLQEILRRVASQVAVKRVKGTATESLIQRYLIGESEEVLQHLEGWTPEEKDQLVFLKEQLSIFLPLTLDRSSVSNYTRTKDGKKIVACAKGERRDAKFGNPIEEINYSIQDYIQNKVALPTLRDWILDAKKEWIKDPEAAERRFHEVLPNVSLGQIVYMPPDDFEDYVVELLTRVNGNPEAVRYFLIRHLKSLRGSGIVASMNPQDSVAMSCAVSGMSATTGSLGSLHDQFQKDLAAAERVQQEMLAYLRKRSYGPPIRYNPLAPLEVLKKVQDDRFCAIVDGNGAYRSIAPEEVAKALLQANPTLKRVDFYEKDGSVGSVGDPSATLAEKGFYFPQAQTRGSDQQLRPDGVFLKTAGEKGDIEDFIQEDGRARAPGQKILLALSEFASPSLDSLEAVIALKKENEKAKNGEDRYRAEPQRLRQIMRQAARQELLQTSDLAFLQQHLGTPQMQDAMGPFLDRFKELDPLFIQTISAGEMQPGDYFEKHKRLISRNADPVQELKAFQQSLIQECTRLGIPSADLERFNAEVLRAHLPKDVLPLQVAEAQQQEVEEELEVNNQIQVDQEQEQEKEHQVAEAKVAGYPPRYHTTNETYSASQFHSAFSPKILLRDPYLPLKRKDPLHKRRVFDDRMGRVGTVQVLFHKDYSSLFSAPDISKIIIGDLLDEVDNRVDSFSEATSKFQYDIRTNCVTSGHVDTFQILRLPEFKELIAQVKFFDGNTDGYTTGEIGALRNWLVRKGAEEMRRFFALTILKNRPEQPFRHSQLWNLFEEIRLHHSARQTASGR